MFGGWSAVLFSPGGDVWEKRRNELISYNDCLYRNVDSSFVLPIDIDEIIVPRKRFHQTWQQVLNQLKSTQDYGSISVRNAYFFKDPSRVDDEAFFLQNTIRTQFSNKGKQHFFWSLLDVLKIDS